jgi:hypothetical protein
VERAERQVRIFLFFFGSAVAGDVCLAVPGGMGVGTGAVVRVPLDPR